MTGKLCTNIHCSTVADHECGTDTCTGACKCIVLKDTVKYRGKTHGPIKSPQEFETDKTPGPLITGPGVLRLWVNPLPSS